MESFTVSHDLGQGPFIFAPEWTIFIHKYHNNHKPQKENETDNKESRALSFCVHAV